MFWFKDKLDVKFPDIEKESNYLDTTTGRVFTGQQVLSLLGIASPVLQAMFLLSIVKTDREATQPETKYGTE